VACSAAPRPSATYDGFVDIVILTDPPGGKIVVDAETLAAVTPLKIRHRRQGLLGVTGQILIRALPVVPGECHQALRIDYNEPAPDTVRFQMDRCPRTDQDFARIFDVDEVDDPPERLRGPMPVYPQALMQAEIEGIVMMRFVIDTSGTPEPVSLQALLPSDPGFVASARRTVLGSVFKPGRLLGRKVRTRVTVPIAYTIRR
jgi:hypothetical protein